MVVNNKELIHHYKFFGFVLRKRIELSNDEDADVFASWKVGGQDFYVYGVWKDRPVKK